MPYGKIIGISLLILKPDLSAIAWYTAGLTWWLTLLLLAGYTSITLSLTYFGAGGVIAILKKFVFKKKHRVIQQIEEKKLIRQTKEEFQKGYLFGKKRALTRQEKLVNWLKRQKLSVIILLEIIPFVPYLPSAVIIAVKALGIKHGYLWLILGNLVKIMLIVALVYLILW